MERDYFNKSNIDFSKFTEAPMDPQHSKIYTYCSEIPSMMQEHAEFTKI
jgi:hypothetical protein